MSWCNSIAGRIPLAWTYGLSIKVGLAEESSCFVVRSEHHFSKRERTRQSFRKHLFEMRNFRHPEITASRAIMPEMATEISELLGIPKLEAEEIVSKLFASAFPQSTKAPKAQEDTKTHDLIKFDSLQHLKESVNLALPDHLKIVSEFVFRQVVWVYFDPTLRLHPHSPQETFSEYLGFIDLRLHSRQSPIALGLLAPPRIMSTDSSYRLILGDYGPIFGGPSFSCCTFSMHDPETSGAECTQSAAINCLTLLSDRGVRLLGGYTLSYLGKPKQKARPRTGCIGSDERISGCFTVQGLRYSELASLLSLPLLNASVSRVQLPEKSAIQDSDDSIGGGDKFFPYDSSLSTATGGSDDRPIIDTRELSVRLFEAYIDARFPAIIYVNHRVWLQNLGLSDSEIPENVSHAIVVIGYRRSRPENLPRSAPFPAVFNKSATEKWDKSTGSLSFETELGELVVNDPGYLPFLTVSIDRVLSAAAASNVHNYMQYLFVGTNELVCHALDCIAALNNSRDNKLTIADFRRWRSFVNQERAHRDNRGYKIALVHRDDIIAKYFHPSAYPRPNAVPETSQNAEIDRFRQNLDEMNDVIEVLPNSQFWCIACFDKIKGLECAWLFDSSKSLPKTGRPWDVGIFFSQETSSSFVVEFSERIEKKRAEREREQLKGDVDEGLVDEGMVDEDPPIPSEVDYTANFETRFALRESILSSCSTVPLQRLASEVTALTNIRLIDLYVLRDIDIEDIAESAYFHDFVQPTSNDSFDRNSSTLIMSHRSNVEVVCEWVKQQLSGTRIAALATYFPHIVDLNEQLHQIDFQTQNESLAEPSQTAMLSRSELASLALRHTVLLALQLKAINLMDRPIIEIVGGTILDVCECDACQNEGGKSVFKTDREKKIRVLCERLRKVVQDVRQIRPDAEFVFAIEVEPGPTYVIDSLESLAELVRISQEYDDVELEFSRFLRINLDIGHLRILQKSHRKSDEQMLKELSELMPYVVHAHLSDNPGMHTKDQVPGNWFRIEQRNSFENQALKMLATIPEDSPNVEVGRTVALELEGCSRFQTILQSLIAMKYMTRMASRE